MKVPDEQWLPIVGHEEHYGISDHGRVRSNHPHTRAPGGILTPVLRKQSGRIFVNLSNGRSGGKSYCIHRMVLEAFVGPCPPGMEALHADDDPTNNHLSNLRWGTKSENGHDAVRNGNHSQARKTHCPAGHEYTPENTYTHPVHNYRVCRSCQRIGQQARRATR